MQVSAHNDGALLILMVTLVSTTCLPLPMHDQCPSPCFLCVCVLTRTAAKEGCKRTPSADACTVSTSPCGCHVRAARLVP